jgi:hypothetical protein
MPRAPREEQSSAIHLAPHNKKHPSGVQSRPALSEQRTLLIMQARLAATLLQLGLLAVRHPSPCLF